MLYIIVSGPLFIAGSLLIFFGLDEIIEEKKFVKFSVKTKGEIIGVIDAMVQKAIDFDTIGKFRYIMPIINFETLEGNVIEVKSKKVYHKLKTKSFEVRYNPKDPYDVMIDSFYKVSRLKQYLKLWGGILFLLASFVLAFHIYQFLAG